ncbi:MAG: cyclic nucleotide-binding domain-containing protein [Pedosphaera sp.]|nr:cyclic nucleotide-binding domain-containing protein [Pedosphaera sp.]
MLLKILSLGGSSAYRSRHCSANSLKPREVPAGQRIFDEGAVADGLFVVLDGVVEITVQSSPGREHLLSRDQPGDYFGEMAVFDGGTRSASATAITHCVLNFVSTNHVHMLLDRSPFLAASLVRDASLRMREFNRRFLLESLRAERLTLVERLAKTIVHDFRNPLNVIGLAADLAVEERATLAARRAARDRVHKQAEVLNSLMQELLDFTRITPANVVLAQLNYGAVMRPLMVELQEEASRRGVIVDLPSELPETSVRLDPLRLFRVLSNLFQNAFDALSGRSDGRVTLRFTTDDDEVITEVEDNGPGIPSVLMPHVFEPFVTFGKAHGTGLGLAICERIVTEHGGRITASNASSGGAVVRFSLPRR